MHHRETGGPVRGPITLHGSGRPVGTRHSIGDLAAGRVSEVEVLRVWAEGPEM